MLGYSSRAPSRRIVYRLAIYGAAAPLIGFMAFPAIALTPPPQPRQTVRPMRCRYRRRRAQRTPANALWRWRGAISAARTGPMSGGDARRAASSAAAGAANGPKRDRAAGICAIECAATAPLPAPHRPDLPAVVRGTRGDACAHTGWQAFSAASRAACAITLLRLRRRRPALPRTARLRAACLAERQRCPLARPHGLQLLASRAVRPRGADAYGPAGDTAPRRRQRVRPSPGDRSPGVYRASWRALAQSCAARRNESSAESTQQRRAVVSGRGERPKPCVSSARSPSSRYARRTTISSPSTSPIALPRIPAWCSSRAARQSLVNLALVQISRPAGRASFAARGRIDPRNPGSYYNPAVVGAG